MSEVVEAFTEARRVLEEEAVAIVAAQIEDFPSGRMGPATAVRLVLDAMWQRPDVVPALAAYFAVLADQRQEAVNAD